MLDDDAALEYISGLKSKFGTQQSGFKAASKRKHESQLAPPTSKPLASVRQSKAPTGIRLKSAFAIPPPIHAPAAPQPPSRSWSRNPKLVPAKFVRTMAEFTETCQISWKSNGREETIYVPSNLAKNQGNEGYIGHGYSKFAFYVRSIPFCQDITAYLYPVI
jgi:hypothetical protein